MDLRQFRYLIGVADVLNFTRAATALHVSQPALSQQIKDLEDELGVRIFERSARSVRITEAGALVIEHARRALASVEALKEAVEAHRGLRRGRVRIGVLQTFTAFYLPLIVARFLRDYPQIDVEVHELSNNDIHARVATGELSVGIGLANGSTATDQYKLYSDALAFVCARSHPLAVRDSLALDALKDERVGLLNAMFATRADIDALFASRGVHPRQIIEFNTFSAILAAVFAGACVSVMPADAKRVSPALDLHFGKISPAPPRRTVCLLKGPKGLRTPAAEAFAGAITAYFLGEGRATAGS